MGLTQVQRQAIEKAVSVGTGDMASPISNEMAAYLVRLIVQDLKLGLMFPELKGKVEKFFSEKRPDELVVNGVDFFRLLERAEEHAPDAVTYFACLATLQKARLKYLNIIERQPVPTMDQVGPRGLLQYGQMSAAALTGFMLWRKWLYDIDNRAAQETGYLFEPIIAACIGGTPVSAKKSPIRRARDPSKHRQVDCIRKKKAYEFKMRITIASSGQGRWAEEMEFPEDCRSSSYAPVLIVFDPTPNPKLTELSNAFEAAAGEVYVGQSAWDHLEHEAGTVMSAFLERYVRVPMEALLAETPPAATIPDLRLRMNPDRLLVQVGSEKARFKRKIPEPSLSDAKELPDDVDEEVPGP